MHLLPVSAVQAATEHGSGTCLMVLIFLDRLIEGCRDTAESSLSLEKKLKV